ncbi:MAG: hypothetical protein MUC33_24520 [Desulfobacterales bacterium]|nr:hypothetical protein [Desulfobacterales bacterium]
MSGRSHLDDVLAIIHDVVEKIPFNKVLGLAVESLELDRPSVKLTMREELIGNFIRGSLHGGVISSTLDFMGGLVAFLGVLKTLEGLPAPEMAARFANATGYVLRAGKKVAVTRMELHNERRDLIAVGTGAYMIA